MKAIIYTTTGAARDVLTLGDIETPAPAPAPGEVLVRVRASGVNPSDVKTRAGLRGPIAYPRIIPHSDGAGVIEAVGTSIDKARIGERVWLWNAAFGRADGTAAEYTAIAADQAVSLPDNTGFDAGACLGIPASTACHGVFADGPVAGKTLLVTGGAGAVGHYAIQLAKWGGATVVTTVSGPEKAAHAQAAGADHVINYHDGDTAAAIMDATGGDGVDRIVEVEFGGNLDVTTKVIRPGGVIATYGSMAVPDPKLPFYDLMFKSVSVQTYLVYLLSVAARARVIDHLTQALQADALVHAIAETHALADCAAAHEAQESGAVIGNVVVTVD